MKAFLKQTRISPKKVNLVAALVRNRKAQDAIDILKFTQKSSAPVLKKLIESAVANAENNFNQKKTDLIIKEIIVNEGPTYKRSVSISRGRVHPILKRTSHVTVKLGIMAAEKIKTPKITKEQSKEKETKESNQ